MSDDEYKTDSRKVVTMNDDMFNELLESVEQADSIIQGKAKAEPVSYTHLTLPTTPYV